MSDHAAIWASLPIPGVIVTATGLIGEVNPAAESFFNISSRWLSGAALAERVTVEPGLDDAIARVRQGRAPLYLNAVSVATGAKPAELCDVQIAPVGDTDDVLILFESRALSRRLTRGRSAKTAAKSAIGMAEMLAHEIKNPLAGISGAAQLIAEGLSGEDRDLADLIVEETRRVVALLDQVEEFGNVSPPARAPVNLHDVLDRARRSAAVGFAAHMQITDAYDPSLPLTYADPDQLQQVFLNLLKNAAEASAEGGTIRLRSFYEPGLKVSRKDGRPAHVPLQVEIADDGPGLSPEIAADIFEPFVSGRENGTGLGLALVSKIIADHDGWIGVESRPGRTVFRVSLPVAEGET